MIKDKVKTIKSILVWFLIVAVFRPQAIEGSAKTQNLAKGDANQVIALVNEVRAGYGLAPYNPNSALMSAAQAHSNYQASIGSLTHIGKGGSHAVDRAVAAGYGGGAKVYVTENIYGGRNASAATAVTWWQGDATHLNTMISPSYTDIGVGVAEGGGVIYYTMDVGYVSGSPGQNSNSNNSSSSGQTSGAAATSSGSVIIPVMAATPQADGSIVHTVQSGQALWNIAAIYNISVADLIALNGLTENSFIHPGDKMLIRPATDITSTTTVSATDITSPTMVSATQTISTVMPTDNLPAANTPTIMSVLVDTATIIPQINPSATYAPTSTIVIQNNSSSGRKVDPVLLIIGGLIIVGIFLIVLGSISRRPE